MNTETAWSAMRLLLAFVLASAAAPGVPAAVPPYPPSPIIKAIAWAPAASIVRAARDSDNWPLTWADDDALYTTYATAPALCRRRHDHPDGNTPADRFILLRAPKRDLSRHAAWEFFVRLDAQRQPVWTRDIAARGAAFTHRDSCLRSAMGRWRCGGGGGEDRCPVSSQRRGVGRGAADRSHCLGNRCPIGVGLDSGG